MENSVGGLFATLRPEQQLALKDSDYVIRNCGPVSIRIHLFLNSTLEAKIAASQTQNDQKGTQNETNKRKPAP